MQKITSIHLNGKAYQIEDEGFNALREYLSLAEAQLKENPDKTEIIADLEQAIGEKCGGFLNAGKDVVTAIEIEQILRDMGPVDGTTSGASSSESLKKEAESSQAPKRLFLIREGAWFAGVCTGLAAYFGIDVTIVRIIFVALTLLTGGAWILVYAALMFLVPYADTTEERAFAHGEPFSAQEVINRAKESYSRVANRPEWAEWKRGMHRHEARKVYETHRHQARMKAHEVRRNVEHHMHSIRWTPFFGILSAFLAIAWIAALLSIVTTGAIFGWMIPSQIPLWLAVILLFLVYHIVTGPMRAAKWHSVDPRYPSYAYDGWTGFADMMGLAFICIGMGFAYTHYPEFQSFVNNIFFHVQEWIQSLGH
jgi:phage shock protein PspC (stress-responsive transcriptional regulator)